MKLEQFEQILNDTLANASDAEIEQWFASGSNTTDDLIEELGRLSAHAYLTKDMLLDRHDIITELIEERIMAPRFDDEMLNSFCTFFDFVGPNKEHHERLCQAAFSKQLLRSPENEN